MKLRLGPIVTLVLVALAIIGVSVAFIVNASPYVSVSEARKSGATNVHLKGTLDKSSIRNNFRDHTVTFQIKDSEGETATVEYSGPPPQDMNTATDIVAIGSMKDNVFRSEKLLIKCPSKYEGAKAKQS
jgi:cytochrome c-type biogenesis protein CcmE